MFRGNFRSETGAPVQFVNLDLIRPYRSLLSIFWEAGLFCFWELRREQTVVLFFFSRINLPMRLSRETVSLGRDCPSCPCGQRGAWQEGFIERRPGSLPGGSSRAPCCRRAVRVDRDDAFCLSNTGLCLNDSPWCIHTAYIP